MKSLLPLILVILALTGAITYNLTKRANRAVPQASKFGIAANQLESTTTSGFKLVGTDSELTPTATPTPSVTPTATPKADLPDVNEIASTTKNSKTAQSTRTRTVCTPVYGMANTCTEHVVVDTGAADDVLFNLAGLSYFGGLAAFIKAKTKR